MSGMSHQHGYLTGPRFTVGMPKYTADAIYTAFPSRFVPKTVATSVLNGAFAFLMFTIVRIYAAKLTANLTVLEVALPVKGIEEVPGKQATGEIGAARRAELASQAPAAIGITTTDRPKKSGERAALSSRPRSFSPQA